MNEKKEYLKNIPWGELYLYIADEDITDIKCNSKTVWVKHVSKGSKLLDFNMTAEQIEKISRQIANQVDDVFNEVDPVIEADYGDLRLQILHSSTSPSGINMTIRKTPFSLRIDPNKCEERNYCTQVVIDLIKFAVKQEMGIINSGVTGSGKSEFMKIENMFIPEYKGIITIEDTSELHLSHLFPKRNIIELKTNDPYFDLDLANKSVMRMDPDWVELSEARGSEIEKLLFCRSIGHGILTTMHLLNSTALVERVINMYDPVRRPTDTIIENMVFEFFDIIVHICCEFDEEHTHRFIDEITIYERVNRKNQMTTIYTAECDLKKSTLKNVKYFKMPEDFARRLKNPDFVERWNSLCTN